MPFLNPPYASRKIALQGHHSTKPQSIAHYLLECIEPRLHKLQCIAHDGLLAG